MRKILIISFVATLALWGLSNALANTNKEEINNGVNFSEMNKDIKFQEAPALRLDQAVEVTEESEKKSKPSTKREGIEQPSEVNKTTLNAPDMPRVLILEDDKNFQDIDKIKILNLEEDGLPVTVESERGHLNSRVKIENNTLRLNNLARD